MTRKTPSDDRERERGPSGLPSLRFHYSRALHARTLAVLETLETAADATRHRDALADVVLELTQEGLAYYFVKPVQSAKVGFTAEQTTKLGIAGILRVMSPIARRVIGGMSAEQLLSISKHIRHLMK